MSRARDGLRRLAGRIVGEHRLPVGAVARDRRLVGRALAGTDPGTVLVVGPGLAVRQMLPTAAVDVAGTNPHTAEVTVCTTALGEGTLPADRWDTVVISEPGPDLPARLRAVLPACRRRLLVVDSAGRPLTAGDIDLLGTSGAVLRVVGGRRHRVWVLEVTA